MAWDLPEDERLGSGKLSGGGANSGQKPDCFPHSTSESVSALLGAVMVPIAGGLVLL